MIASAHGRGAPAACSASTRTPGCPHRPRRPAATDSDRDAARTVAAHPEQGWSLLCNGVVLFDDTGELLPGGGAVPPRQAIEALFPEAGSQRWRDCRPSFSAVGPPVTPGDRGVTTGLLQGLSR